MSVRRGWIGPPGHSSWLPDAEMASAWDDSWSHHCFTWLYLAAKPSHVGVDVDGLACLLHHPMVYDCQTMGQRFLTGAAPSCHAAAGGGAFPGDAKPTRLDI
jgi:hypothetical protein